MRRIAIVDDSPAETQSLRNYLDRFSHETGHRFAVDAFAQADPFLTAHVIYDLVFMDIDLPGLNGLECARMFREFAPDTPLIFVTNLAQYALKGYEVDAQGFLVKPVGYDEFADRMRRAIRLLDSKTQAMVVLHTKNGFYNVRVADVRTVEVRNHDLLYDVVGYDEPIRVRGSLKAAAEELAHAHFVRVSSGCLVNMDHIRALHRDRVTLRGGGEAYFSRPRRKEATETITRYLGGMHATGSR